MSRLACPALLTLALAACGGEAVPLDAPPDGGGAGADAAMPEPDGGARLDAGPSTDGGVELGPNEALVSGGVVRGADDDGVWAFLGVPYAAPPQGDLRFAPPAAHPGWAEPRDAMAPGAVCPQRNPRGEGFIGHEDCLTLNVWTARPSSPAPVMVWIHGGGFVQGASSWPIYSGRRLAAEHGVVVVTINYRLGALGFFADEGLAAAGASTNFGVLDQVAALEWVRDNAAAFGGDPNNVTIFGESAGGSSVLVLLGTPRAEGLFHRAISQSGGGGFSYASLASALEVSAELATQAGCADSPDVVACLRGLPAGEITEALWAISRSGLGLPDIGPVVDGTILPRQPYGTFSSGGGNRVPVLIGSNADEAVNFTRGIRVATREAFVQQITARVGAQAAGALADLYPESEFPDPKDAFNAFFSDVAFNCSSESFARAAATGPDPVFVYHFSHRLAGAAGREGSLHGHEIPFAFGTFDISPQYTPTADDATVSDFMRAAWTTFAKDGRPDTTPAWPPMATDRTVGVELVAPVAEFTSFRNGRCEAIRATGLLP